MKGKGIFEKIRKIEKGMRIWVMVGIMALALFFGIAAAAGSVHNMNTSEDFTSIQAAIDNASAGDEIHVDSGVYYENVNVNKQLTLKGIDTGGGKPIVDANGIRNAITLSADDIILEEFIATQAESSAGVYVVSSHNKLSNITAVNNYYHGIYLYQYSNNNTLSGNNASLNGGFGISLSLSNNNILIGNVLLNNKDAGIFLHTSGNNTLRNNNVINDSIGIGLYQSFSNIVSENNVSSNIIGISLEMSSNNTLSDNNALNNSYGIRLYRTGSSNNILSNNTASNNSYNGISLYSSNGNTLTGNNISNNNYFGIYLDSSSNINKIYHNNLIDNINQASGGAITNFWDNGYTDGGNYWSDYTGTDPDNDGIGNIPYVISASAQDNYPLMVPYNGTLPSINHPPNQPIDLTQYKSDAVTPISVGGTTNERMVIFQVPVIDPDGDQIRLEVELRRTDENNGEFNESLGGTKLSPFAANGTIATASAVELINGNYHWRVRTIDEHGNKSAWQDFGGNPVSEPDFTVSMTEFQNFNLAVIADPHLGYYVLSSGDLGKTPGMSKSVTSFTDKLQEIKGQNVDKILVTGDLVQDRKPEFFMAFKNLTRGFSVYAVPGNHDRRQLLWGNDTANYQNIVNSELDWNFSYKGYNFIGLDSGADYNVAERPECSVFVLAQCIRDTLEIMDRSTPESNGLTEIQWNKLNNGEFSQGNQEQIIVLHSPVINANNDSYEGDQVDPLLPDGAPGGNDAAIANYRGDLIQYAINNRVKLVLSGHTHKDAIYNAAGESVQNTSEDRPLFIQTRNNGYRIIEVKDGKVNPFETKTPQTSANKHVKSSSFWIGRFSIEKYNLHAYDSQGRHTGMISCSNDFELGIPDSYYTGDYGENSFVPEVLVGYSDMEILNKITEFRVFTRTCGSGGLSAPGMARSAELEENTTFNQTITDQDGGITTETAFYNVTIEGNSSAIVNVTNTAAYKMEVDLANDGIIDQVVIPDSVSTANNEPQNNISISAYDGNGTINISADSGNITGAGNMNVSMFPAKQFYEFPSGMISITVSDLANGSVVNITIELPENIPTNSQFWEYGKTADNNISRWYRIPFGSNNGDNIITVQLQDGGIGDDDGIVNGIIATTGGSGITSVPGINGRVIDNASKVGIFNAMVMTNAGNSTITDSLGFYSLTVQESEYNLTAAHDPEYYVNGTMHVSTIGNPVAEQDVELLKKPIGTITGSVMN